MNNLSITLSRVVCVSHGFQISYERGFCNGLVNNGVNLILISSDRTDYDGLAEKVKTINLRGSQEEGRPKLQKLINMLCYQFRLINYTILNRKDILHVIGLIDPPFLLGVIEGLWFRIVCKRYVLTIHNLMPHDRHTFYNKIINRVAFKIPHKLVVHTDKMKNDLTLKFGVSKSKIFVMEHGIEPVLENMSHLYNVRTENEKPVILFFGKIAPYKGLDLLINALELVSFQFRFVIAGSCTDFNLRNLIESLSSRPVFQDSLIWKDGFVGEYELEQLFNSADLLTLPYRHIDQSGVLFQSLRFGLPIMATRVGQFEHYVTEEVGEIAEPDSVESIIAALESWFKRRGDFSRSRIREIGKSYEWANTVCSLSYVYN